MPNDQRFNDLISRVRAELDRTPHAQSATVSPTAPDYSLGDQLTFTDTGNATPHLKEGWSPPEPHGTWSLGPFANFALTLAEKPAGDLLLEVSGEPFIHSGLTEQRIRVHCGHTMVAVWNARKANGFAAILFEHTIADRRVDLRFELPDAVSPAEMGTAQDARRLGFSFYTLRLSSLT